MSERTIPACECGAKWFYASRIQECETLNLASAAVIFCVHCNKRLGIWDDSGRGLIDEKEIRK